LIISLSTGDMQNKIKNIGHIFIPDKQGFLISDVSHNNISKQWEPLVDEFILLIKQACLKNLHSIYLRGSVATNTTIKGISDADFLVITNRHISSTKKTNIWKLTDTLASKNPHITRIDVGFYTHKNILRIKEKAFIKLMSLCVYGPNIIKDIAKLKPGIDVAIQIPDLESEIKDIFTKIDSSQINDQNAKSVCVWIMKRLVRSGFELVSAQAQCFTRDLYPCWQIFSKYYPQKKDQMKQALLLTINPTNDLSKIRSVILDLGNYLVNEFNKNGIKNK